MRGGLLARWLKFNAAGALGVLVQLLALAVLARHMNYLAATALAVEMAVLHNFAWHERLTWRERTQHSTRGVWRRLVRFHLANGTISILGNLLLMRWLAGGLGWPLVAANGLSILICSTLNFAAAEIYVFAAPKPTYPEDRERLFI
ncbi:MAG: GtrA family protein [Acidobacteriales bacterium]|nr:GtrA family protein [Terriglobales bacterium]